MGCVRTISHLLRVCTSFYNYKVPNLWHDARHDFRSCTQHLGLSFQVLTSQQEAAKVILFGFEGYYLGHYTHIIHEKL